MSGFDTLTSNDLLSLLSDRNHLAITDDIQRLAVIKCLDDRGVTLQDWDLCCVATAYGHLQSLQYLHEKCGCQFGHRAICDAICYGHIHCLKYMHEQGGVLDDYYTVLMAIHGRLDMVHYAFEHGCLLHPDIGFYAIKHNRESFWLFAYKHGAIWDSHISDLVVGYRCGRLIQYAIEHNLPPPSPQYMDYWNKIA